MESKRFSLAYFSYKSTLLNIVNDHPKLIYYICHKGDPEKFPIEPFLNIQEDCKKLAIHNITSYTSRRERRTHAITYESCPFSGFGKVFYRELCNEGICSEIHNLINQIKEEKNQSHINKVEFAQKFREHFTFNEDPEKLIENKLNEISKKYKIKLPKKNHMIYNKEGNQIILIHSIKEDIFYFIIKINCACSKETIKEIPENKNHFENNMPYDIRCENCNTLFSISYNFFFCSVFKDFSL